MFDQCIRSAKLLLSCAFAKRYSDRTVTGAPHHSDESATPSRPPRRLAKPRIPPIEQGRLTAEQQAIVGPFERRGRIDNVFTTLANHPDLARDWLTFANYVLAQVHIAPPRSRDPDPPHRLAMRRRIRMGPAYATRQGHRPHRGRFAHIRQGPDAEGATPQDRLLLKAVDELYNDAFLGDETWNALAEFYDTKQMMDLVFAVGQYNLVSMVLNSLGVQLDPELEGFPK